MLAKDIRVGGVYVAKVSNKLTKVRVDRIADQTSFNGRACKFYKCTNLATGREVTFRSAAKFRSEVMRHEYEIPANHEYHARGTEGGQRTDPTQNVGTVSDAGGGTMILANTGHAQSNVESCMQETIARQTAPTDVVPVTATVRQPSAFAERFANLGSAPKPVQVAPHVEVRALAGTGKTTTVIEGMADVKGFPTTIMPSEQQHEVWKQMHLGKSDTIKFCAFGNAIAEVLKGKLIQRGLNKVGCDASTLHSFGFAAFRSAFGYRKPSSWAVLDLIAAEMGGDRRDLMKVKGNPVVFNAANELVSLCKQNLLEPTQENLDTLSSYYDVELNGSRDRVYDLVPKVLERCKNPNPGCEIAFDDMIWIPIVLGLHIPKSDVLIVDESQDLNRMQQELAYKAGHRIIYVGDPNQAIFGFAGADSESMSRMNEVLSGQGGCTTLPLTVTRRCGRAIVEAAQAYVPEYQAHESNSEGIVRDMRYPTKKNQPELPFEQTYAIDVRPGDMVLCRCNAPLVTQCFKFIKRRMKANILGRKIGDGLVTLVNKMDAKNVPDLVGKLSDWLASETSKEQAKRNPSETKLQGLEDRHDCILAFTEGANSVDGIVSSIKDVFTDDTNTPGVKFASIHKSKGLESHRVFYLQPEGVGPREDKMQDWELEQERNLRYVAITRAVDELVYVT